MVHQLIANETMIILKKPQILNSVAFCFKWLCSWFTND